MQLSYFTERPFRWLEEDVVISARSFFGVASWHGDLVKDQPKQPGGVAAPADLADSQEAGRLVSHLQSEVAASTRSPWPCSRTGPPSSAAYSPRTRWDTATLTETERTDVDATGE